MLWESPKHGAPEDTVGLHVHEDRVPAAVCSGYRNRRLSGADGACVCVNAAPLRPSGTPPAVGVEPRVRGGSGNHERCSVGSCYSDRVVNQRKLICSVRVSKKGAASRAMGISQALQRNGTHGGWFNESAA